MLTIALTGGIGCGKTTVCRLFSSCGIPIIDTDIIARQLVEPGKIAYQEIVSSFANNILSDDNTIDRKKLAARIFNNPQDRQKLESILHPKIRDEINLQLTPLTSDYVIIAIPLLTETSQQSQYDRVLLIDCTEQQQIERTLSRDQRSLSEVKAIIQSQATRSERIKVADDIINNSFDLDTLKAKVYALHKYYLSLAQTN
ncbi:Dephospho-CoA kinase [hydrothermal vent metagenome]|uniref:Dephospho-CoA kinase n=1 Tax=hydrothermal vent metagenome TaxID=652676 RepID=A0A3B0XLA0_9ZZZZ